VLYVASTALELSGLALALAGVASDRRTARDLLLQLNDLEPRDARERLMGTGLGGAQVNADLAMRLHRQQMELHAGQLANAGRRQSWGVLLFVAGTLAGLAANLLS
jgi:hypothetical protein